MTIETIAFLLGIAWLAVSSKSQVLYGGAAVVLVFWGFKLSTGPLEYFIPLFILGICMAIKAIWFNLG